MGQKATVPGDVKGSSSEVLRLQSGQKVRLNFRLEDSISKAAIKPHQVFIQFIHKKSQIAITYIAVAESTGSYSFKLVSVFLDQTR